MDPIEDLVARLNDAKKLRVWSVIITFFGDAIVPRGGSVSARTVQTLLARMGIEAGTMRTAFSRLTSDGWVVREKVGRSSFFRLSDTGLAPFEAATDRIYAPLPRPEENGEGWQLLLQEETYPEPLILPAGSMEDLEDCFVLSGRIEQIPDWMKSIRCLPQHRQSFESLMRSFAPIDAAILPPLEALAVRCLLIHEWRRILFQFESVSPEFWMDDWPQAECHAFVSHLYSQLLAGSEAWLDSEATGLDGHLPQPKTSLDDRFH